MLTKIFLPIVFMFSFALAAISEEQREAPDKTVELHMVGVSEGNIRTGDRIHGPEVEVTVSRPGSEVALGLGSRTPVRFLVTLDQETEIGQVFLYGRGAPRSEVFVNGEKQDSARVLEKTVVVFRPQGMRFRTLLKSLTDLAGDDRLTSFQAQKRREEKKLTVNSASDVPSFQRTYLKEFVQEERLTDALRTFLTESPAPAAVLSGDGFVLVEDGQEKNYAITLDVPPISHAVAAAYDPGAKRLYGVTLGGEGFLYMYDIAAEQWSVVTSMDNIDATGMLFDPVAERLILAVQSRGRQGGLLMDWTESAGLQSFTLGIKVGDLPGLKDIFEPGNGQLPMLLPLAIDGHDLLVRAAPPHHRPRAGQPEPMSRTYILNLETRETALVAYNGD